MKVTKKLKAKQFIDKSHESQMLAGRFMMEALLDATEPSIPVESGRLKSSSTLQTAQDKVRAGYNTEYAWLNHQGVDRNGRRIERKSGKDKWFARTIDKNKQRLRDIFQEQFTKILSK